MTTSFRILTVHTSPSAWTAILKGCHPAFYFITVFTRGRQWPLSWASWIPSFNLHGGPLVFYVHFCKYTQNSEMRNVYRILVGKSEGKRPLGRRRCSWRILLEWILGK